MTLDECRKVRDLLSIILAAAKDKSLPQLEINFENHFAPPRFEIKITLPLEKKL